MGLESVSAQRWDVSTEAGFLACYDSTFGAAYRCASRLTGGDVARSEDLVHDTFATLLKSARAGTVGVVGPGWVITALRHRFVDRLRSDRRELGRLRLVVPLDPDRPEPVDESPAVLAGLTERERAVLVLRYLEDLSVAEVAGLMGTSVRATESLLQRAKRKARRSEVRHA